MSITQSETIIVHPHEVIKFFVNEESVEYVFDNPPERGRFTLKDRDILESAGFTPAGEWDLTRDRDNHTFDSLDEDVPLEQGEQFTATFKGPTPAS